MCWDSTTDLVRSSRPIKTEVLTLQCSTMCSTHPWQSAASSCCECREPFSPCTGKCLSPMTSGPWGWWKRRRFWGRLSWSGPDLSWAHSSSHRPGHPSTGSPARARPESWGLCMVFVCLSVFLSVCGTMLCLNAGTGTKMYWQQIPPAWNPSINQSDDSDDSSLQTIHSFIHSLNHLLSEHNWTCKLLNSAYNRVACHNLEI